MALYSFGRIKIVSRSGTKSAVASAAYQSGTKIENQYDGVTHDYTGKQDIGETYIRMPAGAPAAWRDESIPAKERMGIIWNAVELASPAQNARLARANYLALQREFTLEQNLECVDRWIKRNCTDIGMGATYTVHLKDGNPHVDVMYLVNEYGPDGKPKAKAKKEYFCRNAAGEERYMDASLYKASAGLGWEKVYKYQKDGERRDMTASEAAEAAGWERINKHPVCRTVPVGGWDASNLADDWRKSWADILNEKFEELGFDVRVDHRSYKEQGLAQEATIHEGWGPERDERREHNAKVREVNAGLQELRDTAEEELQAVQWQIEDLREFDQDNDTLAEHEQEYQEHKAVLYQITESKLLAQDVATKLRVALAKLHERFVALLQDWKELLLGRSHSIPESARRAEAAAKELHGSVDSLISRATQVSRELQGTQGEDGYRKPRKSGQVGGDDFGDR